MEGARSDADSLGLGSVATTEIAGALLKALQESYAAANLPPLTPPSNFPLDAETGGHGCEPAVDWTSTDGPGASGCAPMVLFLQGRVADLLAALAATRKQLTAQSILVLKQQAAIRALEARGKCGSRAAVNAAVEKATGALQEQLQAKEEVESNLHSQLLRAQGQCATLQAQITRLEIYRDASQLSPSQRSIAHDRKALATIKHDLSELKNRLRAKDVQCTALSAECSSLREILDSALQKAMCTPESYNSIHKEPSTPTPAPAKRKKTKKKTLPAPTAVAAPASPVLDNLSFSVMTVAEETPYAAVAGDTIDEAVAAFSNGRRNKILFTRIERGVYLYGRMAVRLRFSANNGELRVVYDKKARSLRHFVQKFEDSEYQQLEAQTTELSKGNPTAVALNRSNPPHRRNLVSCGDLGTLQRGRLSLSPTRFGRTQWKPMQVDSLEPWPEHDHSLDPNSATGAAQQFINRLARRRQQDQQWADQPTPTPSKWPGGSRRLSQPPQQLMQQVTSPRRTNKQQHQQHQPRREQER